MLLGDWDPDLMRGVIGENVPGMETSVRMLQVSLFIIFTVGGLIVLLNVIIALLSDSYAKTKEKKDALNIREQLFLVVEWCEEQSHSEYEELLKDLKWVHW